MKRSKSRKPTSRRARSSARLSRCPYCSESLGADKIHICPAGCCYVGMGTKATEAVCPYCSEPFVTQRGHVCLVLLRLSEPAQ